MGLPRRGWGVGMEALASPIWAQATNPPLSTISGLTPKYAGFHSTRSASFPSETVPISPPMPWAMAGLMVYLARYLRTRKLSAPVPASSRRAPLWTFILWAVCQVRSTTSPTRPMAWLSELMMERAPMSWRMSSAAMVSGRMRLSAKATSSGMDRSRWWHTMSMSRCSSMVFAV